MRRLALSLCSAALLLALPALAAHDEVVKPLKTVVGSIRYGKDKLALKQFAPEEQGKLLLGADWEKGTDAQRKEFQDLFQTLFAKIAFPKIREDFKYLDSVTYGEPKVDGAHADVSSVISIQHALAKQELKPRYSLVEDKGAWKLVDVTMLGDSVLKGIREDQVAPIMKEGGWPKLLELMRGKVKELEKIPLK